MEIQHFEIGRILVILHVQQHRRSRDADRFGFALSSPRPGDSRAIVTIRRVLESKKPIVTCGYAILCVTTMPLAVHTTTFRSVDPRSDFVFGVHAYAPDALGAQL